MQMRQKEFLKGVKTVAKEGSEKLSKQMSKVIKSGKLDNVIASMDAGKHYIVKMRDGTVTAIEKTGLPEKIRVCLGNGCFIAGTLVTTNSGLKPIEEIKIGNYVLSRNEETGEDSYKKVTDTLVRSTQEICTIELETGKIKSTTGHLFMVKDKWWKAAVELVAGDILLTSDGKEQVVKSIKVEEKGYPVTTYNLSVEDNHTFFVGTEKVLTHNTTNILKQCNFDKEGIDEVTKSIINDIRKPSSKLSGKKVDLKWLSDKYKAVEIEGTVKIKGEVRDISRRVYQTKIDWDYIPKDSLAKGLTNKELALKGKSPYTVDKNGIEAKIELHHLTQVEVGSMVEIVATTHDEYTKILHGLVEIGGSFRNNITLDKQYSNFLKKYWRWRAKNL